MKVKTLDANGKEIIKDISPFYIKENTKGRPRKILSEDGINFVVKMSSYMCTEEEIAGCLDMSIDTLHNADNNELFRTAIEKGRFNGKESLRRKQYQVAMSGNTSMLIWLGKQWLGQSEKVETTMDNDMCEKLAKELNALAKTQRGQDDNTNKETD